MKYAERTNTRGARRAVGVPGAGFFAAWVALVAGACTWAVDPDPSALGGPRDGGPATDGAAPGDAKPVDSDDAGAPPNDGSASDDAEARDAAAMDAGAVPDARMDPCPGTPSFCDGEELVACVGEELVVQPCTYGCDAAAARCAPPVFTHVPPEAVDESAPDVVFDVGTFELDTDVCRLGLSPTRVVSTGPDAPESCIVSAGLFAVRGAATLRVRGARSLIVVTTDAIVVEGVVDVAARGGSPGAGAFVPSSIGTLRTRTVGGGGRSGPDGADSGGGGGALCGGGGNGGAGGDAVGGLGGAAVADSSFSPFVGGSPGGAGRAANATGGAAEIPGGGGGGALALASVIEVRITGRVVAAGGGGGGGNRMSRVGWGSGGGGGSGGVVVVESPRLVLGEDARVIVVGGGGGGAARRSSDGDPGQDGASARDDTRPSGGVGLVGGGSGAGARIAQGEMGEAGEHPPHGGGGGGGGAGCFVVRVDEADTDEEVLARIRPSQATVLRRSAFPSTRGGP